MAKSADPDLDLHCLQKQGISGFSRTRVNILTLCLVLSGIVIIYLRKRELEPLLLIGQ